MEYEDNRWTRTPCPTASNGEVTATEDTDYTFTAPNFNFSDTDAGAALSSVKITSLPAGHTGTITAIAPSAPTGLTATASGTTQIDLSWTVQPRQPPAAPTSPATRSRSPTTRQCLDHPVLRRRHRTGDAAHVATYAHTGSGRQHHPPLPGLGDQHHRHQQPASNVDDATTGSATNTPAAGAPTITGTAQVGQTLTAVTTAIMDADGLNNVSYTYQWIRVDGGAETNIAGAMASTYTLVTADQGKTIKVKVRFTDDASNPETRTSAATAVVVAARRPRVSITSDLSVREDIGTAVVPVTLSWPAQVSLSVPWSTSELSAESPDDYTDGRGALTFAPGASRATISIPIADDGVQEDDEFFSVTLETGEGYSLEHASGMVTILDNDDDELLPSQVTVDGTTLVLTYDEVLDSASTPSPSHFYVTADGMRVDVDQVSVDGTMVTLTLATAVQAGQTVTLGYAGGALIKDVNGNAAVSFSAWLATNTAVGGGGTEPPGRPAAPSVSATAGSGTSLDVTWAAPSNTGPAITSYDLQYRQGTSGNFTNGPQNVTGTSAAIGSLTPNTSYEVQVRATNAEGDGDWSFSGTGQTGASVPPDDGTEPPGDGGGGGTEPPGGGGGGTGTPGVTVSKTALTVPEEDTTGDSYTVVLDSEPAADVTVTVAGHAGTAVTTTPATLTFTTTNWDTAQTVTVTAGNDADTADETVSLTHGATSTDTDYDGITVAGVAVTVNDNDTAQVMGVTVAPGNAHLVVTWTAVDNATGYTVQWTSGGDGYNTDDRQATVTPGSTMSHTIDSLTNGTAYTVRVIATRTGANDGPPSAEMTGTPIGEPEPVPALPVAGVIGLGLLLLGTGGRALRGRARG